MQCIAGKSDIYECNIAIAARRKSQRWPFSGFGRILLRCLLVTLRRCIASRLLSTAYCPLPTPLLAEKLSFPAKFTTLAQPARVASPILPAQESFSLPFWGHANNHRCLNRAPPARVVGSYENNTASICTGACRLFFDRRSKYSCRTTLFAATAASTICSSSRRSTLTLIVSRSKRIVDGLFATTN